MQQEQVPKGENRPAQVLRVLREEGIGSVARKLYRFVRSRFSEYKSQKGQDRWVLETLKWKRNGFFVDLAASDGVTFNNSWVLEKKFGWKGVAIEPNPYFFPRLASRRSCKTLELAIDSAPGSVPFRIDIGGLGGIVANGTGALEKVGQNLGEAEIVEIASNTLTNVLDECGAPTTIDYLSLDVEGAEARVLEGLDLEKYTFFCLTIEAPNEDVHQTLLSNGYLLIKSFMNDSFYIHRSHPRHNSVCR